ncbi:exonuclease SbcCD subunit D [uncultured Methanomethylovorans sp.]|uniref:metallophosphoesterase family protein n=1 Tax=uncultured Methanomethylovorans sp. TaxID=183759 RepID=UPI0026261527|nr:exonuclease SbcCD subunit D [uncultured Methanomethylovorans sp.]
MTQMDREIKIIHTADTHIGYRQYHSDVRRKDFLQAFSTVIDDAIKMKVDAVVHAGDLFDSRTPSLEDILDTMKLFSRLKGADIPLLAIVGNHESKQSTQWLDLFESMGLAIRLGTIPYTIEDVAFFGIDSVPRSKIPLFDFSVFEEPLDSSYNVLVMHQLMSPITIGEWDCASVIGSMPFHVDVMLLGDYHKYEKTTVGDTWVTYCGSTERNSLAEKEDRSYNIITMSGNGIDISRRTIRTREFLRIPVTIRDPAKIYEDILSAVKEHEVEGKVVFVEIIGDDDSVSISYAEIEEMLLSRNVLVPGVRDLRKVTEDLLGQSVPISFYDPDEAIKDEIKKMNLSEGGLLMDEIVRDLSLPKTKVSDEAENRLSTLLEIMDFSKPIPLACVQEKISLLVSETENEATLSLPPEITIIETERSEINRAEGKVPEPENGPDIVATEKENEKHPEKKQKASAHAKPKQYNLGDYL